jgi:alpha-amylase
MPALMLYFQVHQPFRIKRFSYFDIGSQSTYFDETLNRTIMQRVAERCYIRMNTVLLDLIDRFQGKLRVSFSLSGVVIEQMKLYAPEALESFRALNATGCVEFLGETYYHSLASLFHEAEFKEQVQLPRELLRAEFGVEPQVFRNTELIYGDVLAARIASLGYRAVLAEGVGSVLGWRSPHQLYRSSQGELALFLRDHLLSDDIAFRFTHENALGVRLSPDLYASRLQALSDSAHYAGIFMDYETFGEHLSQESGIFDFMQRLPAAVLERSEWCFATPSELLSRTQDAGRLSVPELTSWADSERDISAWSGNEMQRSTLNELYALAERARHAGGEMLNAWRKLQSSDHVYYMSTKGKGDGVVHELFSHFESPYKAFIAYRNVLADLGQRL